MPIHLSRSARVIAVTGLALVASPLALGVAAVAATPATPAPVPTASVTPTPSTPASTPPITTPPAERPLTGTVDASVRLITKTFAEKPKAAIATFVVRSTKPATGYHLVITMARGLGMHAPGHDGWTCAFGDVDKPESTWICDYLGKATTRPTDVRLAFEVPQQAGTKLKLGASIRTAEADSNLANNRAVTTIVVPADKPSTSMGSLTGRVWNDANHNGRQDKGEKGVAGARILVTFGPGDSITRTYGLVTTNANGWYTIRGITPNVPGVSGFTFIAATPDKSWSFTKYLVGAARGNSDFQYVDADDIPGTPYEPDLGKDDIIGISDQHAIKAGQTLRLDAGLVRTTPDVPGRDTAAGEESLPKTGAAAGSLLGAGALLVGGGIALTVLARRRRSTTA